MDSYSPAAEPKGFTTLLDTVVAPKSAFESLRIAPTWGWALAVAIVLSAVGSYLITPAIQHAMAAGWPEMIAKNPQLARLTPEQAQAQLAIGQKIVGFAWVTALVGVPIYCLLAALIMQLFNALGRGDGSFLKYFSAACNIAVPGAGLASIVLAVIVILRGVEGFSNAQSVGWAMPSLGMLAPPGNIKLVAFLSTFTPFSMWATGLTIAALIIVGRVPKLQAWLGGIIIFLIPALIAVAAAK